MSKRLNISVLFLVLLLFVPAAADAAPGDLDPSFGTGGYVTTDFGGRGDAALALAVQPDGKIVAAGNSSQRDVFNVDFALARYNADGTLDAGFGSGGTVLSDWSNIDAAADVLVQPDGMIVAAGTSNRDFAIARYQANGALDATFGAGGISTSDLGGFDQAIAVVEQPDGKLVAAGTGASSGSDFVVVRYNAAGSLDPTFGVGGIVVTDLGSFDQAQDVVVPPDGKILVTGRRGNDFALVRYTADGQLDPTFGNGGIVTTDFGGTADLPFALGLDSAGKITVVGQAGNDFGLARYNTDGSLDPTFDGDGLVTTDLNSGSSDTALEMVLEPSGAVTAAGATSQVPGSVEVALARYDAAGNLDPSFGGDGKVTATYGANALNNALDAVAQPDGRIVVAGVAGEFGTGVTDFGVARFLGPSTSIHVTVDVKPDSADNVVTLQTNGVVPVAILSTADFDATTVDPSSVCFGSACVEKHGTGHLEDVNLDGRDDLLLHYDVAQTGIAAGDTQACLTGRTLAGTAVVGCDSIRTK